MSRATQNQFLEPRPETWEEWQEVYNRRYDLYEALGYTDTEISRWNLFKALDESGNLIAQTQNLTRDIQHVVDTGSSAMAAGVVLQDGLVNDESLTEAGRDVWRRSGLGDGIGLLTLTMAKLGRVGIEAIVNEDGEPVLIQHEPQHYRVSYSRDRSEVTRVVICIPFFDDPEISPTGEVLSTGVGRTYVRIMTPGKIETFIDGKLDQDQSGDTPFDTIPFQNIVFNPAGFTEHGHGAAHALARPIALYDSIFSQMQAVSNRMGNPILSMFGSLFPSSGGDAQKFGRLLGVSNADATAGYIEPSLTGLQNLLESANTARINARETLPEFLFAGAGAGASGDALRWRATAFERKYTTVRERLFTQLASITQMAINYGDNKPYDSDTPYFDVEGAPLLPMDKQAELAALETTTRIVPLTNADYVRSYQRLGFVGKDVDPDAYAMQAGDENSDTAQAFFKKVSATAKEEGAADE